MAKAVRRKFLECVAAAGSVSASQAQTEVRANTGIQDVFCGFADAVKP